jgi:hypothetical protein
MDLENVAPAAPPRAPPGKRARGLSARAAAAPGKAAAAGKGAAAPPPRRRALGDITNRGAAPATGDGAKGAAAKHARGDGAVVQKAGQALARRGVPPRVRPVPLDARGGVLEPEGVPGGAAAYAKEAAVYSPPDLAAELGLDCVDGEAVAERDLRGPLDDVPQHIAKEEELPFLAHVPSEDDWEVLEGQVDAVAEVGWRGVDADFGLVAIELPALSFGPADDDSEV